MRSPDAAGAWPALAIPAPGARIARTRIFGIAASAGLGAVLLSLFGFAIWAAYTADGAADGVEVSSREHSAFDAAHYAVGQEESLERKYRLEPSPDILAQHRAEGAALVAALTRITTVADRQDRQLAVEVIADHERYVDATGRMFDAVNAGNTQLVNQIDAEEVDPLFASIQQRIETAYLEHETEQIQMVRDLRGTDQFIFRSTIIAAIIGGILMIGFWSVLRAYQRHLDDASADEKSALEASEARFRSLVQNSSDMITVVDELGIVRYQSPASEHVLGLRPEEVVGVQSIDLVHPDDRGAGAPVLRGRDAPGRHPGDGGGAAEARRRLVASRGGRRQQPARGRTGGWLRAEHPRHQRPPRPGGATAAPGVPRSPHRPRQPRALHGPPGARAGALGAARPDGGGALPRPRRLQVGERRTRPPGGRRTARRRRRAPCRLRAPGRHDRPLRRRRVRRPARGGHRHRGGDGDRRAADRGAAAAVHARREGGLRPRQHRRRAQPARSAARRRTAAPRRRRDVRGEGARQGPQRGLRPGDAGVRAGAPDAGRRPPARSRARRVRPALPAAGRVGHRPHRRRRGADPLAAPAARPAAARRLHPPRRGHRPDHPDRPLGAERGLRAGAALAGRIPGRAAADDGGQHQRPPDPRPRPQPGRLGGAARRGTRSIRRSCSRSRRA